MKAQKRTEGPEAPVAISLCLADPLNVLNHMSTQPAADPQLGTAFWRSCPHKHWTSQYDTCVILR